MTRAFPLGGIDDERRARFDSRLNEGAEGEALLMRTLEEWTDAETEKKAKDAYAFAKGLHYRHPGLSPASYLAHPIRVAVMAMKLPVTPDSKALILGLLHNVYEVSNVTPKEIARRFGDDIAAAIADLTVDRKDSSREYKLSYYETIRRGPVWMRIVKVLDKLDNMFLLCLNADDNVRSEYLSDIEEFILPMVRADLPQLAEYVTALVADCRKTGHLALKRT